MIFPISSVSLFKIFLESSAGTNKANFTIVSLISSNDSIISSR